MKLMELNFQPEDQMNKFRDDQGFIDWLYSRGLLTGNMSHNLDELESMDMNSLYREYNRRSSVRSRFAQGSI